MTAVARSNRDVDRALALHQEIRKIFESRPIQADSRTLEDLQRLCGMATATLSDLYCRDVMRAVGACADHMFALDKTDSHEDVSVQALVRSLLAAFEGRLRDLESERQPAEADPGARTGPRDRRRAQRRDYVKRPALAAGDPASKRE